MKTKLLAVAVCHVLLFASADVIAEQRALLVGVGEYANAKITDLPGIDLDLARMIDTLKIMGFKESEIRTLLDEESTAENILHEMNTWLVDGVQPDDRVFFYYSGHGSNIPDEDGDEIDDNSDEVLVAHDAYRIVVDGKATLAGVVPDDAIAAAIRRSPSRNFMTVVDACHSGTVTRNLFLSNRSLAGDEVFEKSFVYEGMPLVLGKTLFTREVSADGDETSDSESFVSISAAGDGEKAIGTSKGGVFTIGFSEAIKNSANTNRRINLDQARDEAERYIRSRIDEKRVHTPQVTGSRALARSPLPIMPLAGGYGPMWQRLEELVGEGQYFPFKASKPSYVVDELITFDIEVKEAGYLNLITVDAADSATVLFPNSREPNNYVEPGRFVFPTAKSRFDFVAARPLGPTLALAFISKNPVNFRDYGYDGRLPSGDLDLDAVFTNVTHSATRAIKLVMKPEEAETPVEAASSSAQSENGDVMIPIPTGTSVDITGDGAVDSPDAQEATANPESDSVAVEDSDDRPWLYASSVEITVREK